jgi:AraC family transcriptional regulator
MIGVGTINGSFANGEVFEHSHELTVEGICKASYEPDYSYGWSAEAYPKDLSFEATEGTINYICPCKRSI